jgi:hypothetical protein
LSSTSSSAPARIRRLYPRQHELSVLRARQLVLGYIFNTMDRSVLILLQPIKDELQ